MKKAITILAVLIVLVGAVFAEDHTIRIKADVSTVLPVFGLKYGTKVTNSTTQDETTGQWSNAYTAGESYPDPAMEDADALYAGFNLDKGGDVLFDAVLLNPAKQKKGYTLEFSDGVFTASENSGTPLTITPAITRNSMNTTTNNGFTVSAGNANYKVRVVFDGRQVVNGGSIVLATAKYHYDAKPNIDMPTNGDYYYADVTLTITADASN